MSTAFLTHPSCHDHPHVPWHPESPQRLTVIEDALHEQGLYDFLRIEIAPRAERAHLARVHSPTHIEHILARAPRAGVEFLDPDTFVGPDSPEAALRAAGAVVRAAEMVLAGDVGRAFCSVRPPGHHATATRAMGFCLFNNVAVGAAHALATGEVERIAILDFDAHAGNGTESIFARDPRVLLCSTFQHPFYPYTDPGSEPAHVVNVPLRAGDGGAEFRAAVRGAWLPALARQRPQLIFVSAGFDGHVHDDMSDLRLTDADYAWVTQWIVEVAERHAGGRIVSVLEGGYALPQLGPTVAAHVRALMGL